MVLIGGIIIDRIGTRRSTFLFALLCLLGAVITVATGTLEVMAAGRLVFGLGAESLIVAVTTAIAKWFKGKELSFAFGMNLTIARLGSFAALNSPSWGIGPLRRLAAAAPRLRGCAAWSALPAPPSTGGWRCRRTSGIALGNAGSTDKLVLSRALRFRQLVLVHRGALRHVLLGIFPFQTFAVKFFMEAHGTDPRDRRVPVEHADALRDDRDAAVRAPGGPGGEAGAR